MLLFAFSDFARHQGLRIQPKLFPRGLPTTIMLRHRDSALHAENKQRILAFVGGKLGRKPPTPEQEEVDSADTDAFYEDCVKWLRDHTREPAKAFKLVLEENITYGFRRNLLGMKYIGLGLSALTLVLAGAISFMRYRAEPQEGFEPTTFKYACYGDQFRLIFSGSLGCCRNTVSADPTSLITTGAQLARTACHRLHPNARLYWIS